MCIWQLKTAKKVPPTRKDTDFQYAAEILITKSELEDKNKLVFTLQQQVDETKTESEYQLRLKDNKYAEEARLLKKKFNSDISDLKQVNLSFHTLHKQMKNLGFSDYFSQNQTQQMGCHCQKKKLRKYFENRYMKYF